MLYHIRNAWRTWNSRNFSRFFFSKRLRKFVGFRVPENSFRNLFFLVKILLLIWRRRKTNRHQIRRSEVSVVKNLIGETSESFKAALNLISKRHNYIVSPSAGEKEIQKICFQLNRLHLSTFFSSLFNSAGKKEWKKRRKQCRVNLILISMIERRRQKRARWQRININKNVFLCLNIIHNVPTIIMREAIDLCLILLHLFYAKHSPNFVNLRNEIAKYWKVSNNWLGFWVEFMSSLCFVQCCVVIMVVGWYREMFRMKLWEKLKYREISREENSERKRFQGFKNGNWKIWELSTSQVKSENDSSRKISIESGLQTSQKISTKSSQAIESSREKEPSQQVESSQNRAF